MSALREVGTTTAPGVVFVPGDPVPTARLSRPFDFGPVDWNAALRGHFAQYGHLRVPTGRWQDAPGGPVPLGLWMSGRRRSLSSRRLFTVLGAPVPVGQQYFLDGLWHIGDHFGGTRPDLPMFDRRDGFPIGQWFDDLLFGEIIVDERRRAWVGDAFDLRLAPTWFQRTFKPGRIVNINRKRATA